MVSVWPILYTKECLGFILLNISPILGMVLENLVCLCILEKSKLQFCGIECFFFIMEGLQQSEGFVPEGDEMDIPQEMSHTLNIELDLNCFINNF